MISFDFPLNRVCIRITNRGGRTHSWLSLCPMLFSVSVCIRNKSKNTGALKRTPSIHGADKVLRRVFAQTELSCCAHRRAHCRARLGTQSFTHRIRQRDQAPNELVKLSSLLLITIKSFDRYVVLVFHSHSGARCVRGLDS